MSYKYILYCCRNVIFLMIFCQNLRTKISHFRGWFNLFFLIYYYVKAPK